MKRCFAVYTCLIIFALPAKQAWAQVTCDTVDFYFTELPKSHYSLTPQTMNDLAHEGALKIIGALDFPDDASKNRALFGIQTIGPNYKEMCALLSSIYANEVKKTSDEDLSSSFLISYLETVISSIDPHTYFLVGEELYEFVKFLGQSFEGLGIEYHATAKNQQGPFRIVSIMPQSSALHRGLQIDDLITHVNGLDCAQMTLAAFYTYLTNHTGNFSFKIMRGGHPLEIGSLTKGKLFLPTLTSHFINQEGLAYIQISRFSAFTSKELIIELTKLKEALGSDLKGILIDLRDNGGGAISTAVDVVDAFIDEGLVSSEKDKTDETQESFYAQKSGSETDAPILILANNYTASASELAISALQDYGRALVVGTQTFGKGTTLLPLLAPTADPFKMSLVYYTSSVFYRPSGQTVQQSGITPDILIIDPQREKLIREAREKGNSPIFYERDYENSISAPSHPTDFSPPYSFREDAKRDLSGITLRDHYSEMENTDIQLTQALDYLKIITRSKIDENHFGAASYYRSPHHRLHINTDLYESEAKLIARFQFKIKETAFPNFWDTEDTLIYETFAFVTGNELTLSLKDTPVETYINKEKSGSLKLNVDIQKRSGGHTKTFSCDTILLF